MTIRTTTAGYEALQTQAAILPDLDLALIELTGQDCLEWLQGQVTNDLRGLKPGHHQSFCLCEATGQILAICDVWVEQDRLLLTTDRPAAAHVLDRAATMVILEDVQATDLTGQYSLTSVQGPEADSLFPKLSGFGGVLLRSSRLGSPGWDLWTPSQAPEFALPRIEQGDYEVARIEAGIPRYGVDYTSKTLPPELGPAFEAKHVSYNKGCYVGQEVLMRIHSRGHTNKTWVGIALEAAVEPGERVSHISRDDAGVVTSAAVSPTFGPISTAVLRNEAAVEGEEVRVGPISGHVVALPFKRAGSLT